MYNNYNHHFIHIQLGVLKIFMLNEWVGASDHEEVPHSFSLKIHILQETSRND